MPTSWHGLHAITAEMLADGLNVAADARVCICRHSTNDVPSIMTLCISDLLGMNESSAREVCTFASLATHLSDHIEGEVHDYLAGLTGSSGFDGGAARIGNLCLAKTRLVPNFCVQDSLHGVLTKAEYVPWVGDTHLTASARYSTAQARTVGPWGQLEEEKMHRIVASITVACPKSWGQCCRQCITHSCLPKQPQKAALKPECFPSLGTPLSYVEPFHFGLESERRARRPVGFPTNMMNTCVSSLKMKQSRTFSLSFFFSTFSPLGPIKSFTVRTAPFALVDRNINRAFSSVHGFHTCSIPCRSLAHGFPLRSVRAYEHRRWFI